MSWERICDHCRTFSRADLQVPVDVFPLGLVCEPCVAELMADEDDPRDPAEDESDACDLCDGAGCRVCLAVPGWNG